MTRCRGSSQLRRIPEPRRYRLPPDKLTTEPTIVQRSKIIKTRRKTERDPLTGEKRVRTWKVPVFVVRVKQPNGKYKQIESFPTDDEEVERPADQARRLANDIFNQEQDEREAAGGAKRRRRHIGQVHTIEEAAKEYIRSRERKGLRKGTIRDYQAFLDHHVLPWFERRWLGNVRMVRDDHFAELRDDLLDDRGFTKRDTLGKPKNPPEPLLPPAKREIFRLAKAVLDTAVQRTWIKGPAPGAHLDIEFSKAETARQKAVTKDRVFKPEEVRILLVTADRLTEDPNPSTRRAWGQSYRGLLYLAAYSGLRVSELLALTFDRLDLGSGIMSVSGAIDRYLEVGGGKSDESIRDVRLHEDVILILREMLKARGQPILHDGTLVWASRNGRPLSYSNIHSRAWEPLLERSDAVAKDLGLKPVQRTKGRAFHGFRHFVTSVLRQQELPVPDVSAVVGHGGQRMTDRYTHRGIFGPEAPRHMPEGARARGNREG